MRVAIFDFDGTLYEKETFQIMMNRLKNHPIYYPRYRNFFLSILPRFIGYKMKVYPEKRMKERSMQLYLSALKQLSKTEVETYLGEIAKEMQTGFNPLVLEKLNEHIDDDVYVMLVSGAYTPLVQMATQKLQFDQVIGTDILYKNNIIDSLTPVYHINGQRKNEKIDEALRSKSVDWKNSYAYADSLSDLSVLELVGNPVAVQPDSRLHSIAKERNWEVI